MGGRKRSCKCARGDYPGFNETRDDKKKLVGERPGYSRSSFLSSPKVFGWKR